MRLIHYIKLRNFKVFGDEKTIELDQPSVLIGPNNSGKTSVLQALALWSMGVKRWVEAKGNSQAAKNITTGINRLDIIQVPVQEARYFWKNTEIRKGSSTYIPIEITVGVELNGEVYPCKMVFTHYTPEIIYCAPEDSFYTKKELINYAASLNIEILYPMSGMTREETLLPIGRINVLIGQGLTAEVLRNLCYQIVEFDKSTGSSKWQEVVDLMHKLFNIRLNTPVFIQSRGTIELTYRADGVKNPLDISLSGRGQQQMLLMISYLFSHQNAILLLDEPDAHLEILRQKLVFTLLRDLASQNKNQVIIATHSEVILEEAADTNLTMIIEGDPVNVARKNDIKSALSTIGIEHYFKAKTKKKILYVEGSTDMAILKEMAVLLDRHDALQVLEGPINYYYTRNSEPSSTLTNQIDIRQGYYLEDYRRHFFALKKVVPAFRGLAIFDSDDRTRPKSKEDGLMTFFWTRYEIENYFINPSSIRKYFNTKYAEPAPLFKDKLREDFELCLRAVMQKVIFDGNTSSLQEFLDLPPNLQATIWSRLTERKKLSTFLEKVFDEYKELTGQPILLNKGNFYQLVKFSDTSNVHEDIHTVLDLIVEYLSP
ncbi:MAG: AAA family ATPase [Bacteroidia bacterium]|nr:AAA family ATPase [Bacteroidia bacterium]